MAPEQAAGDTVDERTDLYSWGVVAYELLAGAHPFAGRTTAQQWMAAHIAERPVELRRVRPEVPSALAALVMQCLEKDPRRRPPSAEEVLRTLDDSGISVGARSVPARSGLRSASAWTRQHVAVVVAVLVTAVLGATLAWRERAASLPSASATSASEAAENATSATSVTRLAVLPFENLGRPEDGYVVDGLTDEIRAKLSSLAGVQVIARASSNSYRHTAKPPQIVASELGVRYLLTGTVRSEPASAGHPARIRVSPELVQISSTAAPVTRWSQGFDAEMADVFQVQSDVASQVARALDVALGPADEARLAERPTRNLAAYDAYLHGESASDALSESNNIPLRRALVYYQQAATLDSTFVLAWSRVALTAARLYKNGEPTPALAEIARTAAQRARTLAPASGDGYLAIGGYHAVVTRDFPRALAELSSGLRVAPSNGLLLSTITLVEQNLGHWDSALVHARRAATLDPRSVAVARRLANTLLWLHRYPEAQATLVRARALAPTNLSLVEDRAMVDLGQGDLAGARAIVDSATRELDPANVVAMFATAWDLYWVPDDAQQRFLLTLSPAPFDNNRGNWGLALAETYQLRGDSTRARAYADSSHVDFERQLHATPSDPQLHTLNGLALAYMGRRAEAIQEGERGLAMLPISADAYFGAYSQHQLVRIYLLAGQPQRALELLEPLLRIPYYLSPRWLRIDPTFTVLRGNPSFERLAGEH
jgi:serine/threonine-protein kinase